MKKKDIIDIIKKSELYKFNSELLLISEEELNKSVEDLAKNILKPKKEYGYDNLEIKSYHMNLDCGRQGKLASIFNVEEKLINILLEGNITVYFGEVLGKHSEVYSRMNKTIISKLKKSEINLLGIDPMDCSFCDYERISSNYNVDPNDYETVKELCIAIYESRK